MGLHIGTARPLAKPLDEILRAPNWEGVLTVMEGAVMQARTHRDIGYFDRNIAVLRDYITSLMAIEKNDSFA